MLLTAEICNTHVITIEVDRSSINSVDTLETFAGEIFNCAKAIVEGVEYQGLVLSTVGNDSSKFVPQTLICEKGSISTSPITQEVSKKGVKQSRQDLKIDEGILFQTLMASAVSIRCNIYKIGQEAQLNGVGLTTKMNIQLQAAEKKWEEIKDVPFVLSRTAELIVAIQQGQIEFSYSIPNPIDVVGITRIDGTASSIDNILQSQYALTINDFENAGLNETDVAPELKKFGLYSWFTSSGSTLIIDRTTPAVIKLDDVTKSLLERDSADLYGLLIEYVKAYFVGKNEDVVEVACKTFKRDLKRIGLYGGSVSGMTTGPADYISSNFENGIAISNSLMVEKLLSSGVIELELTPKLNFEEDTSKYGPWLNVPIHEWPTTLLSSSFVLSNDTMSNNEITLKILQNGVNLDNKLVADALRGSVVSKDEVAKVRQHIATMLAILYTASHLSDATALLTGDYSAILDGSSLLNRLGFKWALPTYSIIMEDL
jgi:hypothetical protein